jgi:phosphomannomutase
MVESDFKFSNEVKAEIRKTLFEDKKVPDFGIDIDHISYRDGLKVYFKNGGWIISRFSGTEPLLRIFCEMETEAQAAEISNKMRQYLKL